MSHEASPEGEFYRLDLRHASWRECWYATRSPTFLILALVKLLRLPLRQPGGVRRFASSRELVIEGSQLPSHAREAMGKDLLEFAALGFGTPLVLRLLNSREEVETYAATMPHSSGDAVARLLYTRAANVHPARVRLVRAVISSLAEGRFLVTSGDRPELDPAPWVEVRRLVGAPPERLWPSHQRALEQRRPFTSVLPRRTREDLIAFCDDYDKRSLEHLIERGLFVPMSPAEVEQDRSRVAAARALIVSGPRVLEAPGGDGAAASEPAAPSPVGVSLEVDGAAPLLPGPPRPVVVSGVPPVAVDAETAAVMVSMEEQASPKTNWTATAWLFVLSLGAFVGSGLSSLSWERLGVLLGVLFFHELGHYSAMRLFHYRNVRMFFLPFLGAAVSGSHLRAAGWKKALVSLAGPVPGILAGLGLSFWNVNHGTELLEQTAWMALFLNGFNLLPFLPLDGGWFLNAVLFCRHPWFEAGFKVIGGGGLVALGTVGGMGTGLTVIGVFILISIPPSLRNAGLARQLRSAGVPTDAPGVSVPPETAAQIVRGLRAQIRTRLTLKTLAGQALDVFERLNARPPRWPASSALLALYAASLVASVLGLSLIVATRRPDLLSTAAVRRAPLPACQFAGEFQEAGAQVGGGRGTVTLLATFGSKGAATACYRAAVTELAAGETLTLFGQSVFATLPLAASDRNHAWSNRLAHASTNLARVDLDQGQEVWFDVAGRAENAETAKAIRDELSGYLAAAPFRAWPPWAQPPGSSPGRRESARRAARTLARLRRVEAAAGEHPTLRRMRGKLLASVLRGSTNVSFEEMARVEHEIQRQEITKLLTAQDAAIDPEMVRHRLEHRSSDDDSWRAWIEQRLDAMPTNAPALTLALAGDEAVLQGLQVRCQSLTSLYPAVALPALCRWLLGQGCVEVRYEIHGLADDPSER